MSVTWNDDAPPPCRRISVRGWIRLAVRAFAITLCIFAGLILLLPLRVIEARTQGQARPWTPHITRVVCRISLFCMGLRLDVQGRPMHGAGACVANHSSWLDIFVLNALDQVFFVSKSEVSHWPGIGFLARATGTLFIARDPRAATTQTRLFAHRLRAGHRLLFFPEGTSTDGLRVLPFKSTLFQALFDPGLRDAMSVQPVSVNYHAPGGADARAYGWWGDMAFGPHLLHTLALAPQGHVELVYHDPIHVRDFADRKALALAAEQAVRKAHAFS